MASYVIAVYFTYKLVFLYTNSKLGASLGALVLALNPNFLYLATTPMTEPLLLATFTLAAYFIAKYTKTKDISNLILGGVFVMASTLTRYDGWFLFITLTILIGIWGIVAMGRKKTEGALMLFLTVGGLGIFLWLLWNKVIFGDPLYFITGPYSAYAQQKILRSVGQLPTQNNWYLSLTYYFWAIVANNGLIIPILALFAFLLSPFMVKSKQFIVILLAVFSPFVFNVLALYLGQSAMNVPQAIKDPGLFNIRYGVLVLPALAFVLGIVASSKKLFFIVLIVFLIQSYIFVKQGLPVALQDGLHGLKNTYYTIEASNWLAKHYDNGLILTSLASHDAFVARAQLPMKLYIHEGTREHWLNSLKKPSDEAKYIATMSFPPDLVYKAIGKNPDFKNNYVLVHSFKTFGIYKRM